MNKNKLLKPDKLTPGDTIGIISPAGAVKEKNLWKSTVEYFESKGYKVKIAPNAQKQNAYLAGDDESRLSDLMNFFQDDEVKAIICSRGGYGTYRILSEIDYSIIKNNPKIFVGYSDITALLIAFLDKANLITFHGPLALSDFGYDKVNSYTEEHFFSILEGKASLPYQYTNPVQYECINPGTTHGVLIGGNLAVLTGLLGTSYFPDMTSKILLLEDVGEPLYRIDRMLMQLKLAGVFEKVSGLLFGEFTSVVQSDNTEINKQKPIDIVKDICGGFNIPIGYGFTASHAECKATLPFGVQYYFDSADFSLVLKDSYLKG